MKAIMNCGLIMLFTVFTQHIEAQKLKAGKVFSGGFGIETGLMVGDKNFRNVFGEEYGLSARFAYKAGPGWITLTPGAAVVVPKTIDYANLEAGLHTFIKAGYKYIFLKKLFIMGEAGYGSYSIYSGDENGNLIKNSLSGICFAPTIGGNFGKLEIGLKYENTQLRKSTVSSLGLRLGFNF